MHKRALLIMTPFIITAYPILYMLSANVELVDFADIALSIAIYETITLVILLILKHAFKDLEKTVFMTNVVVIIFFTYGHLFALLNLSWGHWVLLPLHLLIVWLAVRVINRKTIWLPEIIKYMRVTGSILAVAAIGSVLYYGLTVNAVKGMSIDSMLGISEIDLSIISPEILNDDIPLTYNGTGPLPDIYYIILDEYANNHTLLEMHGFDNSPFLDSLRDRGFFIAEDSRANYPATFLSLASSLNMGYVNFLSGRELDFRIPYHLIDYNRVSTILRNAGYQIVYFPSLYYVTSNMESADVTYRIEREIPVLGLEYSNFDLVLFNSTLLGKLFDSNQDYDVRNDYRESTLHALENLRLVPEFEDPTFTFAHLAVPHRPYVFTPEDAPTPVSGEIVDGQLIGQGTYALYTEESNIPDYLQQINFINRMIISVIDDILAKSDVPPIIIVQSDHGHRMQGEPGIENWGPAEIYDHVFPILNAYYLPDYDHEIIPTDIAPVNTFRMLFDYYFGTRLGFIGQRNFYPEDYFSYDFIEVTDGIIQEVLPAPDIN